MMKSEFIERVGFEPTEEEYREIEQEYIACDIDKDQFCKEWKKNGGVQRLSRLRVSKIDELERQLDHEREEYSRKLHERNQKMYSMIEEHDAEVGGLHEQIKKLQARVDEYDEAYAKLTREQNMATSKLNTLRKAYLILSESEDFEDEQN